MRLRLTKLDAMRETRPPGYAEDVLARGTIDGEWLDLPDDEAAALREKYRPPKKPEDKPLPSVVKMVKNVAVAAASEAKARGAGAAALSDVDAAARLLICRGTDPSSRCPELRASDDRCAQCGCYVARKTKWVSQRCPLGKW
jgi:hypothetical protein